MEQNAMSYVAPEFVEIKMDAEIGSYQEDGEERPHEPLFGRGRERAPSPLGETSNRAL